MNLKRSFFVPLLLGVLVGLSSCGGKGTNGGNDDKGIKDEKLHPFLLSGMYCVDGFGGKTQFFNIVKEGVKGKPGTASFRNNLHEGYTHLFIFPAGTDRASEYRKVFKRDWDINSKEDLLETENYLLTEGHSAGFEKCKKAIDENGGASATISSIDLKKYNLSPKDKGRLEFIKDNYDKFSKAGIKAWDIARYVNNINLGVSSKYLTEEEGLELSKKALAEAQKYYDNWNDYFNDFNLGRLFWGGDKSKTFSEATDTLVDPENAYSIYNYMGLK